MRALGSKRSIKTFLEMAGAVLAIFTVISLMASMVLPFLPTS